jgi:hypothetical protein
MRFERKLISGKTNYLVFDIEDIAANRRCVCPYLAGELQEAIEHADLRDGFVVSADWTGFITVEHVAPKVHVADIAEQAMSPRIDDESFRMAMAALTFIRVNSPEGSCKAEWAHTAIGDCAAVHRDQRNRWYLGLPDAA